jgi:serine/threonine-protein kinase
LTLRDRYRPLQRLAVGGMGEIWCAEDTLLGRSVAIKMVRPEYADDPSFGERFRNEARHAAVLTHPNVTQVFDFDEGSDGRPPYIVMEFVDGQPVADLLEQHHHLTDEQTWSILGQTAAALAAAHAIGVVHRDIKPGNVLVCSDGRVKVTDFGIARAVDQPGMTQPGLLMGTASYLAPELCRGEPASPASDMYALGVLGYECLTGRPPFSGELATVLQSQLHDDPPPLPDTVSPALRDLVSALLSKDPAARPSDAAAVAAQAQRLSGRTIITGGHTLSVDPYPPTAAAATAAGTTAAAGSHETQAFDEHQLVSALGPEAAPPATPAGSRRTAAILLAALGGLAVLGLAAFLVVRAAGHGGSAAATRTTSPAPKATPIRATAVSVFEQGGSGADHPEELSLATDGSSSSAWFTEHYATADFGSLKSGSGIVLRVPSSAAVRGLTVRFAEAGVAAKIYAGDSESSLLQQHAQATTGSAPRLWRVQLDAPIHAKYWLVWITKLAPDGGSYRAGIADVHFTG